jgi:hypothetical protein
MDFNCKINTNTNTKTLKNFKAAFEVSKMLNLLIIHSDDFM